MRPVLPALGFVALSAAMIVTGGPDVAVVSAVLIAIIFIVGSLWVQRLQDRLDAASQAETGPGTLSTPAAWLRASGASQKGELRITADTVSWKPGRSSTTESWVIPWSESGGVGVQRRGAFFPRASIVVMTTTEPLLFTTAARLDRVIAGLDAIGVPRIHVATER